MFWFWFAISFVFDAIVLIIFIFLIDELVIKTDVYIKTLTYNILKMYQ